MKAKAKAAVVNPLLDGTEPEDPALADGWALVHAPPEGVALEEALSGLGSALQAQVVDAWLAKQKLSALCTAADSTRVAREARKAAQRALHILRSRGIEVPERAREQTPPVFALAERPPSYLSLWDDAGLQMAFWVEPARGGVSAVAVSWTADEIVQIGRIESSRRQLRQLADATDSRGRMSMIEVTGDYVAWRLARLLRRERESTGMLDERFADAVHALRVAPEQIRHPIDERIASAEPLDPREIEERVRTSRSLWSHPWLGSLRAPDDELRSVLLRVDEVASGLLVLNEAQKAEAVEEEVARAAERLFDEDGRIGWALRLRDTALSLMEHGDAEDRQAARTAVAVALALESGRPVREIAFATELFRAPIAAIAESEQAKRGEQRTAAGVIVPPGAGRVAAAPAGSGIKPSGAGR